MISSTSKWTLDPSKFEMSPNQLTETHLPPWIDITAKFGFKFPKPSIYPENTTIDDFSPNKDGKLCIVPFSQLDNYIQNGDVIIFMERKMAMENAKAIDNVAELIKQRGWHGEIAYRDTQGAFQCAPWGGPPIKEHPCVDLKTHRCYLPVETRRLEWNLHIFRLKPDAGLESQIRTLLDDGVRRWRKIFNNYQFPQDHDGIAWFLDPVDFKDVSELEQKIACQLIRNKPVQPVYCMQWVHTVLSLSLNVPCNRETLTRLGILDDYQRNWAPALGFADDGLKPIGRLPINPYTPSDVVCAACSLYLGLPEEIVRSLIIPGLLAQIPALQNESKKLPSLTMPPITPLMEYRKPGHRGEFEWEYVATAFDDKYCMEVKQ
jgi:hypothetical protein